MRYHNLGSAHGSDSLSKWDRECAFGLFLLIHTTADSICPVAMTLKELGVSIPEMVSVNSKQKVAGSSY